MTLPALKRQLLRIYPKWGVAISLLLIAVTLSLLIHAPFQVPSLGSLLFIGFTYLLPFFIVSIWILLPLPFLIYRGKFKDVAIQTLGQISDALCFGIILILHFHIKLWAPLINPASYDRVYEAIDRACFFWMDPLISWRSQWQFDWLNHLYFNAFMFMFACSFIVHNLHSRSEFRRVFLASILVQAFGAVCYLIAPALGPFIYHQGANTHVTSTQHHLLDIHQALLAGGTNWLQLHTSEDVGAGLAAMPSLHLAASFVFLYYAQKYCRWLTWFYWPCFLWIVFEAMASRWHYGIDLIAGLALAYGSICLAHRWLEAHEAVFSSGPEQAPVEELAPLAVDKECPDSFK
ncbi:MAG TPA: phosphatase PAP2 family protein [Candidatus Methylacidiphilales bacterium]